jgi:hypothetical protein
MKFRIIFAILSACSIAALGSAHASTAIESTRNTVKEWVQLEKAISTEAIQWQEKRVLLQDLITVTEAEIATIEATIADVEATRSNADSVREELVAKQTELRTQHATVETFLAPMEAQLVTLKQRLPAPLLETLSPFYQRIPKDPSDTSLGIAERMQTIVGILSAVQQFDRNITVSDEIRTLADGSEGEVQTVYIGLGAAYYRTSSGSDAGIGSIGPNGWQWKSQPDLDQAIDDVIAIAQNTTQEARFIELPVSLQN